MKEKQQQKQETAEMHMTPMLLLNYMEKLDFANHLKNQRQVEVN